MPQGPETGIPGTPKYAILTIVPKSWWHRLHHQKTSGSLATLAPRTGEAGLARTNVHYYVNPLEDTRLPRSKTAARSACHVLVEGQLAGGNFEPKPLG